MKAQTKSKLFAYGVAVGIALSTTLVGINVSEALGINVSQAHSHPAFMPPGNSAPPPSGWLQFCLTYRGICKTSTLPAREVLLDERAWRVLKRVNDWVNQNVAPMTDMAHYGMIQWWRYPDDGAGACHSYALLKQRLLEQAGWPRQALLMTVVRDRDGEGHAVLTVKTNKGDFILDNLTDRIRLWSETGYQYIERQSQYDPNQWVWAVGPGSSQAHPLQAEEVSVDLKPVIWPTWTTAQIADSSEPTNLDELPAALVSEVVDRIKLHNMSAAEARKQADQPTADKKLAVTAVAEMVVAELDQKTDAAGVPGKLLQTPTVEAQKQPDRDASAAQTGRWGVQLIGSPSESAALASYHHLQETYGALLGSRQPLVISTKVGVNAHWYRVRVTADDRDMAQKLCKSLQASGGSCLVQRG